MESVKGLEGILGSLKGSHPNVRLDVKVLDGGIVSVNTSGYRISSYNPYLLDFAFFLSQISDNKWTYTPYQDLKMGGIFQNDKQQGIDISFSFMGDGSYNWSVNNHDIRFEKSIKRLPSDEFESLMQQYAKHLGAKYPTSGGSYIGRAIKRAATLIGFGE